MTDELFKIVQYFEIVVAIAKAYQTDIRILLKGSIVIKIRVLNIALSSITSG
jgi:hypothetical protein